MAKPKRKRVELSEDLLKEVMFLKAVMDEAKPSWYSISAPGPLVLAVQVDEVTIAVARRIGICTSAGGLVFPFRGTGSAAAIKAQLAMLKEELARVKLAIGPPVDPMTANKASAKSSPKNSLQEKS